MKNVSMGALLLLLTLVTVQSCIKNNDAENAKTFVLVHGAWQAAYVWDDVKSQLEKKGQKVVVVNLPAHGDDTTSPAIASLELYRDKVIAAINNIKGPVVLVGHSMAGMVVSLVGEKVPDRVEKLVYVGAYLPKSGQSLFELSSMDKQSIIGPALIPSKDQLTFDIQRDQIINIFCQDGSEKVKQEVLARFKVEPAIPFIQTVTLTAANFGKLPKYYIHTLQDHAVGPDLQKQMIAAAGIKDENVYPVNSGHCPFLSIPGVVTDILFKVSR